MSVTSMGIGGALRELGRFLDECEQRRQIDSVALADDCSPGATGQVTADIELTLSACPATEEQRAVSLAGTSVDDDGRLQLSFESVDAVVPERTDGVELEPTAATFDADGTVSITLTASTTVAGTTAVDDGAAAERGAAADGSKGDASELDECSTARASDSDGTDYLHERETDSSTEVTADGTADVTADGSTEVTADGSGGSRDDRDVPPFQDHVLLREVYESCETFAEMADAIEMDVTAETVRRYMIDAGIHEPNSYDIAGADDAEREPSDARADLQSPVVVTDGIGLPDDVTVDTLVETVRTSSTIYEVKNDVGIGRDEALEMLQQLDLLDHVVGRLATKDDRDVSRDLVVERLRQNAEPR